MNDAEVKQTAELLAKLQPGFLPFPIFHQVARLTATPIIELVPLRTTNDGVEILLQQRPADDPIWPDQLHVPGTVIRATDKTYNAALERVITQELSLQTVPTPTFVKNILHHSGRGTESSLIFWLDVTNLPPKGEFYNAAQLPETLVQSQLDFVADAVRHFSQTKHL